MSLPPYKHRRNPCLQTEDEPMIPGLAGAPLITYRCVQEKRRTSDQRVARILPAVEFEYEYVPHKHTPSGSEADVRSGYKILEQPKLKSLSKKSPTGASGDRIITVKGTGESNTRNNVAEKSGDRREPEVEDDDAKSICSRRSTASRYSHSSQKTERSDKTQRSGKRCDSRESVSSTLDAVLKTPSPELCFQKFGRISNGLDDDDLRPRSDPPTPSRGCCLGCILPCPTPQLAPFPSYPCPAPCTIISCAQPVQEIRRPKITCKAYFPTVEPIKSVRFAPALSPPHTFAEWTNLTYRPIIQGGICYHGVDKLVPIVPPPGPPTLCRPTPIRPSDPPGMTVYSAP